MSFNGDGAMAKRMRTDSDSVMQRDHTDNYNKNYEPRRKRPESEPNNVLLFTIINPVYPITVDVLHTICKPNGQVLRIVIFKKNGVQAMVEFDNIDTAKRVKEALNGADIYAGCCTLKIEFAKPTKLNVYKNDMDSWDYTNPTGMGGQTQSNYMDFEDNAYTNGRPSAYGDYVSERYPPAPVDNRFMVKGVPGREGLVAPPPPPPPPRGGTFQDIAPSNGVQGGSGCVLMAYGLDSNKANPDKLFNLFCLYGNVIRVKFLKTKEGCAMVQMGDSISVERCINHLKNMPLFGGTLQLGYSKQTFLSQVAQPYNLPDNSVSFKDFSTSKNNRFMNPSMASKNRIQGPAKILHFFNTPPDITEEQLLAVIEEKEVNKPSQIKLFPKKDRSSSGLMEFDNLEDAVNCLVYCNHVPIKNPDSKFPYMMKLCFSSSRSIKSPNGPNKEEQQQ